MSPNECGFCRHGNPPNSRFCNACGAPLTVAACTQCGAVNDVMATTCQKCDAPLAENSLNDFFLPLPPPGAPADPASPLPPTEGIAEPDSDRSDTPDVDGLPRSAPSANGAVNDTTATSRQESDALLAQNPPDELFQPLPPEASANSRPPLQPTEGITEPDSDSRDTPDVDGLPSTEPSASTGSGTFRNGVASSPRRRVPSSAAALVIIAIGVSVYFGYRHFQRFQPSDAAPRPASTPEAQDRTTPPAPGKPKEAPSAAAPAIAVNPVVGANPPPATPASDRGGPAASQAKATVGNGAGGKGGHGIDPAGTGPARPQPPTDIFIAKPESDQRRAAPKVQEAPKTAVVGTAGDARPQSGRIGAGVVQRPPGAGPCTDALAALGLCTQENTQGRKQ